MCYLVEKRGRSINLLDGVVTEYEPYSFIDSVIRCLWHVGDLHCGCLIVYVSVCVEDKSASGKKNKKNLQQLASTHTHTHSEQAEERPLGFNL